MARIEESTLFRPDPKLQYPGRSMPGGSPSGPGRGGDDDDGPTIGVRERILEAVRSTRRRKGLSFLVTLLCGVLTVLASIFAPRTYEVESSVLVQRTAFANGPNQQETYISPDQMRITAKQYEMQALAQDSIIAIVQQKDLVARWDGIRQPHRKLIDRLNQKLGKAPPTDNEKFEALVANIKTRMMVWVDASTVTVKLSWPEPESAKDIVEAAVKNFLEARYQTDVGEFPVRLKIQESFVTQAHKDLEAAAGELVRLQKANDPNKKLNVIVPALPQGVKDRPEPPADADPVLKAKLENVRTQIATLQNAKTQRLTELNQQLVEKQQTLAPQHPDIIALRQTIAASEADPPQLASLRAQEGAVLAEIVAQQKAMQAARERDNNKVAPRVALPGPAPEKLPDIPAMAPKNVQDAQVQFDTVTAKYQVLVKDLQDLQVQLQTSEAAYKNRYKITQPAEVPFAPKRPVGLIAIVIGIVATFFTVLFVAALADRFSGIFFEPRDVRDRLGLPVFATFS